MKSNYEERAKRFIHSIYNYITDCVEPEDFEQAMYFYNCEYNRKVIVQHGLTRVALITSDYVIKINCGTLRNLNDFGDCEKEVELYEMAEEEGFDYLLAKITPYYYGDMVFYIMPRIHGVGRTYEDANYYMTFAELDWCAEKRLFDLHNGNYGWRNKHICLIDYAACALQGAPAYLCRPACAFSTTNIVA